MGRGACSMGTASQGRCGIGTDKVFLKLQHTYTHTRVVPVNRGLLLRPCTSNSLIFSGYVYIHIINILYKYGWNHRSDNKFMNLSVTVCRRERRTSIFFAMKLIKSKR